ncbi:hypothetical protein J6590_036081 [Homalodisca vitripennis]|nr:hypothetical protein J6590_036081 [Homalodisca vitripennis]
MIAQVSGPKQTQQFARMMQQPESTPVTDSSIHVFWHQQAKCHGMMTINKALFKQFSELIPGEVRVLATELNLPTTVHYSTVD